MTQPINPEAIMARLRELLDELEAAGWLVSIHVVCASPKGGTVTFDLGEGNDSNADP